MPITRSFNELRDVAKIRKSDVQRLIQDNKVRGRLRPLSVEIGFFKDLRKQTEKQGGLDNLLYFIEAANLIIQAEVTNLIGSTQELKYALTYGLSIDQRLVADYDYWKRDGSIVKISGNPIFYYIWKGENIGLPLLIRQAVEELINIFERYRGGIHILRKPPRKKDLKQYLISNAQFIEKHDPENRIAANIEGHPLVFICGGKRGRLVYMEESKRKPTSSYCGDYDSKRIKFATRGSALEFLGLGLRDWSRIARYECKGRYYGAFFFQLNLRNIKTFLANFPIHPSLIVDKYLKEDHYKLVDSAMQELLSERGTHSGIDNPGERFPKLVGLYKKYRKEVYKP